MSAAVRLALLLALALAACGESRQEAAQRIGEVDIDPRKTAGSLRKTIGATPQVKDSTHHKARDLVKLEFSAKGGGEPLLELWFHSASAEVTAAARPITVIARSPFKGSILGVRPGDARDAAVRAILRRLPRVLDHPGAKPPPIPPGGWIIPLEGAHLAWTPRMPGKSSSGSADDGGELRYVDRRYSVHEGVGISLHTPPASGPPMPAGIAAGSFPFLLRPTFGSDAALRILADGSVVAEFLAGSRRLNEIAVASNSEDGPALTAKILLPCGWRETPVFENSRFMPRVGADGKFAEPGGVSFAIPGGYARNYFIVDNRRGPEATLKLGEVTRPIPADSKEVFLVPAPDCESATDLELHGRTIAKLPVVAEEKSAEGAYYMLDPTGRRCYQFRTVQYGTRLKTADDRDDSPVLVARQIHRLPAKVDHVFEKAPDKVKVWVGMISATNSQVLDVSCPARD